MLKECREAGKKGGLKSTETSQAVVPTAGRVTPESGPVTAAQQLQWKTITQRYSAEISVYFCCLFYVVLRCADLTRAHTAGSSQLSDN